MSTATPANLLLPTDFSDAARATYPVAAELVHGAGGIIHLVHEAPLFSPHVEHGAVEHHLDELDALLAREAKSPALEGRTVHRHVLRPGRLEDFERERNIDFILASTHGRRGAPRELLGSFSERLLRTAIAPLLLHREGSRSHAPGEVLVPFDFSEKARRVLPLVRELAERHGTHFKFLYVHEIAPRNTPFYDALHSLTPEIETRARKRFEAIREVELRGVVLSLETTEGVPQFEILERLKRDRFDMALLGTHGIPGRVAQNVTRLAPCSVLAVRGEALPRGEAREGHTHRHLGHGESVRTPSAFSSHVG